MTLWLGNTAYLYISVSFAQMLKAVSKNCRTFVSTCVEFHSSFSQSFSKSFFLSFGVFHFASARRRVSHRNNGWTREAKPTDAFYNVYH